MSLQCVVLHGSKCESAMTTISRMSKSQLTFLGKLGVLKLLQANMHLSNKTSLGTSRQVGDDGTSRGTGLTTGNPGKQAYNRQVWASLGESKQVYASLGKTKQV